MTDLNELTTVEASGLIANKQLSPVDLMEALITRSSNVDEYLHIWVSMDPERALVEAKKSEDSLVKYGPVGPLHGIPIGIKDIIYTAGIKTTGGSQIYANFVPTYDATVVENLKRAGAIIMGKTVTTEFAGFDPPPTRNPWNMAHTPGGSSSGSAAGVAARVFPAALGSQTNGSVIRPASYNGIVGLKPTFDRISRYGVMPVSESLDTVGHFARSVEDVALLLEVMTGQFRNKISKEGDRFSQNDLKVTQNKPWKLGVLKQDFFDKTDSETLEQTNKILDLFANEGIHIENASISKSFDNILQAHGVVMAFEASKVHEKNYKQRSHDYGPAMSGLIQKGQTTTKLEYSEAKKMQQELKVSINKEIQEFDAVLTPSTPSPAPRDLTTTGDPVFQTLWTFAGLPTITLPTRLSKTGMPMGIQLASNSLNETTLLNTATWCEEILGFKLGPPNRG